MKAITLKSASDELIGAFMAGAGVVGGALLMQMATGKVNPWLVSGIGIVSGYGLRLVSTNENIKYIGTGLLVAGSLDATKKVLDKFAPDISAKIPIPTLSGPDDSYQLPQAGAVDYNLLKGPAVDNMNAWNMLKS